MQSRFHGLRRTGGEWLNNSFSRNCFVINILSHDPSRVGSLSHDRVTCWSHRVTWSCRGHPSTFWRTRYIINNYKQDYVPIVKKVRVQNWPNVENAWVVRKKKSKNFKHFESLGDWLQLKATDFNWRQGNVSIYNWLLWLKMITTDCNLLQLIGNYWISLQLVAPAGCSFFTNWLQLLKPFATDCMWMPNPSN